MRLAQNVKLCKDGGFTGHKYSNHRTLGSVKDSSWHLDCLDKSGVSSLFPHALVKEEGDTEMKVLSKIVFSLVLLAGLSVAASAQKDGDKKPPPKEKPPVVKPQPKPPPDNSNKGKHGGEGEALAVWRRDDSLA